MLTSMDSTAPWSTPTSTVKLTRHCSENRRFTPPISIWHMSRIRWDWSSQSSTWAPKHSECIPRILWKCRASTPKIWKIVTWKTGFPKIIRSCHSTKKCCTQPPWHIKRNLRTYVNSKKTKQTSSHKQWPMQSQRRIWKLYPRVILRGIRKAFIPTTEIRSNINQKI